MQNEITNMIVSMHMMLPVAAFMLLQSGVVVDAAWPPMMAKPGCQDKCGNVTIPYPFGMGPSCYYNEWYSITCDNITPTLSKFGLQVLQIGLGSREVRVASPFSFNCTSVNSTWTSTDFSGSPYTFSIVNVFAPVHCIATALSNGGEKLVAQCGSVCNLNDGYTWPYDTEESVCLTDPPYPLNVYSVNFTRNSNTCSYVFLVDGDYLDNFQLPQFQKSVESIGRNGTRIPVVLGWDYEYLPGSSSDNDNSYCGYFGDGTYTCECPSAQGLGGNPYLPNGCQYDPECDRCKGDCYVDVDDYTQVSCFPSTKRRTRLVIGLTVGIGSLLLAFGGYWLLRLLKRRKENKQRDQNLNRNGSKVLDPKNGDSTTQQTFPELNQMNADVTEIDIAHSNLSTF